jgi:hypothetical protein
LRNIQGHEADISDEAKKIYEVRSIRLTKVMMRSGMRLTYMLMWSSMRLT